MATSRGNAVTVAHIRQQLTAEQNNRYKDYQIDRWIAHKAGDEQAVVNTINNQPINEGRVREIFASPERSARLLKRMNHNHHTYVHIRDKQQFVLFLDAGRQPTGDPPEVLVDEFLVMCYYLLGRAEELLGDGAHVDLIMDQRNYNLQMSEARFPFHSLTLLNSNPAKTTPPPPPWGHHYLPQKLMLPQVPKNGTRYTGSSIW